MNIGIYSIRNMKNNKIYVGQSVNIHRRWQDHLRDLNNKSHGNKHLQNSWDKYGEGSFVFKVLENCTLELLNEREGFYMDKLNSLNSDYGYNMRREPYNRNSYTGNDTNLFFKRSIQYEDKYSSVYEENKNFVWCSMKRKLEDRNYQRLHWTQVYNNYGSMTPDEDFMDRKRIDNMYDQTYASHIYVENYNPIHKEIDWDNYKELVRFGDIEETRMLEVKNVLDEIYDAEELKRLKEIEDELREEYGEFAYDY